MSYYRGLDTVTSQDGRERKETIIDSSLFDFDDDKEEDDDLEEQDLVELVARKLSEQRQEKALVEEEERQERLSTLIQDSKTTLPTSNRLVVSAGLGPNQTSILLVSKLKRTNQRLVRGEPLNDQKILAKLMVVEDE